MNRTIKRTITITITETWTIVWTSADEPPATAGQGPNSEEGTQAAQPATQTNAILDSLPKEQCPEHDPQVPQVLNQTPGRKSTTPTHRRRKQC
jgi:hypothetical protein